MHTDDLKTRSGAWPRTQIDRFILAELEARGLAPAPPADRRALLRRANFDLTGLPPAPDAVEAFVNDSSPDAFEKVVDRLLASPAYGERWARHWLDVAGYADYYQANPHAHGFANQFELFEAYRYRDWVVAAFDRDLPYDQFVLQRRAGTGTTFRRCSMRRIPISRSRNALCLRWRRRRSSC